jgi:hypothetical protein
LPKLGPLLQISHTAATFVLLDYFLQLAGARLAAKAAGAPIRTRFMRAELNQRQNRSAIRENEAWLLWTHG